MQGRLQDSDLVERQDTERSLALFGLALIVMTLAIKFGFVLRVCLFLIGLLGTGFGLLCLYLICRNAKSPFHFLSITPVALFISYGIIAFVFPPTLAEYVVPGSWEWPVSQDSVVQPLSGGKWAVAVEGAPKVQIYDSEGRYLYGWFVVPAYGHFLRLVKKDGHPDYEVEETILVQVGKRRDLLLYDLDGNLVWTKESQDRLPSATVQPTPGFFSSVSWYKWPLVDLGYALSTLFIGIVGEALLRFLGVIPKNN